MPICTVHQVKQAARIDGTEFDGEIPGLIAAAQSAIEHECGVAAGTFTTPPNAGVTQAAIAMCVLMIDSPTAGREEIRPILNSSLLDGARTWI